MRKDLFAASMIALTVAVAPACATKGFVRTEVGEVNTKVDTLTGTVEETQERTRTNTDRIGTVDQKAEAAARAATDANRAATDANSAAAAAAVRADEVGTRVDDVVAASRRLIYEVTLSEDQSNFKFGAAELPDEAKARIDELVAQLKAEPQGVYIEIEGHTDNVGSQALNERLGMERAETVKRYLYEQHQVPLHKINVISYGEEKPIAPNNNREGRAQNRRVVVKVLS
jgi:outer membrane protein OmpA-like peptidoglycan-associated protein